MYFPCCKSECRSAQDYKVQVRWVSIPLLPQIFPGGMVAISLFFASLLAFTRARPTFRSTVIHEKRHTVPAGFSVVGPAPNDATIKLRIGLSPNNISGLEDALLAVSTPSSPLYGQYLTQDEVFYLYRAAAILF